MPLVVRTPMGGKRGYGPTHSQSIEKHFLGIQDLRVLALNGRMAPFQIYHTLLSTLESPHLVIENKILYTRFVSGEPPAGFSLRFSNETYPTVKLSPIDQPPSVTVVCYGGMLEDVEQAVERAFDEQEIACEIICPSQISPLNIAPILESVIRTGRLLTVEEGSDLAGFGSEVIAAVSEAGCVPAVFRRIGYYGVIPACMPRELELLANPSSILKKIIEVAHA
jgi:2-oxoisovalerate dehydrogenase E1 component